MIKSIIYFVGFILILVKINLKFCDEFWLHDIFLFFKRFETYKF